MFGWFMIMDEVVSLTNHGPVTDATKVIAAGMPNKRLRLYMVSYCACGRAA